VEPALLSRAAAAPVVTFGSPSAVKAWVALVGLEAARSKLSVCIGSTSAKACASAGLDMARVYFPDSPGVEGWVESVERACGEHGLAPAEAAGAGRG
jgi:uroporphyrinogen-III synthase